MINLSLFVFLISSCAAFTNVVEDWTHPGWRLARNTITIRIPQGLIRGEMEFYDGMNRSHISYRGIPYAQGQQQQIKILSPDNNLSYQLRSVTWGGVHPDLHLYLAGMESDTAACLDRTARKSAAGLSSARDNISWCTRIVFTSTSSHQTTMSRNRCRWFFTSTWEVRRLHTQDGRIEKILKNLLKAFMVKVAMETSTVGSSLLTTDSSMSRSTIASTCSDT